MAASSVIGSFTSTSSYGYGQMIAWRVTVNLGNGIMTFVGSMAGSAADRGILLVYAGLNLFEENPRPGARDTYNSTTS